ncbi:hypothetical protein [Acinetobacter phage vB_AbaM_IME284]|nr:hypothetical protein [Acinetobacter phage vB_AbaM_IME284]
MESYKIRVNNESESKEAQELFFELGYEWKYKNIGKNYHADSSIGFLYADNGCITTGDKDHGYDFFKYRSENNKLVTLPQLRDLVVLNRNDSRDANVNQGGEIPCLYDLYLTADKELYFYHCGKGKWLLSNLNHDEDYYATLKPIEKSHTQDPALISGDVALANVHKCIVQYLHDDEPYGRWTTITDHLWSQYHLGMFLDPDTKFKFRFKPQTIKVELELPKPFEPKVGEIYWYLTILEPKGYDWSEFRSSEDYRFYCQFGAWRTEDEIKQVVEQLRKIKGAV